MMSTSIIFFTDLKDFRYLELSRYNQFFYDQRLYVRCHPKDDVRESSSFYPVAISVRGCRQITICICWSRQKALLSVPVLFPDGAGSVWDGSWWRTGPSSGASRPAVPAGSLPPSPWLLCLAAGRAKVVGVIPDLENALMLRMSCCFRPCRF